MHVKAEWHETHVASVTVKACWTARVLGAKLYERHSVSVRVSVTDQGVWDRGTVTL